MNKKTLTATAAAALVSLALAAHVEVIPRMSVSDQTTTGNTVVVPAVVLDKPGYVAVHGEKDGQVVVTPPIGVSRLLPAGLHRNVTITLTGLQAGTQNVYPMLHHELNNNETYEFPGPDAPVQVAGKVVVAPVKLMRAAATGAVMASDQAITLSPRGAVVTIASVTLPQAGFVALHTSDKDGNMVGLPAAGHSALLPAGTSRDVMIMLDANVKVNPGDRLWAMAHVDANGNGTYEFPSTDGPLVRGNDVVMVPFTVR